MANYRKIWEDANGPIPKDELGRSYEIHHIDGNRKNNDLSNLMCVSIQEHYDIHKNQKDYIAAFIIAQRLHLSKDEMDTLTKQMAKSKIGTEPWNKGKIGIYSQETLNRIAIASSKTSKGRQSWNKGLNKANDERIKNASEKISKSLIGLFVGDKNPMKNPDTAKKAGLSNKGRIPWNKGLTKENDDRVKNYSKKLSVINNKK